MESMLVGPAISARFSAALPGSGSGSRSSFIPVVAGGGLRQVVRLRCAATGSGKEECNDGPVSLEYKDNEIFNSVEVIQWESGMSLNDILVKQGIRIRRRHCHPVDPSTVSKDLEFTPQNILEQIIWDKEVEVAQGKERHPLSTLMKSAQEAPPARDFLGFLRVSYHKNGLPALIAEVKKASPSRGILRENFDPVQIAQAYEKNGAACLSILTDERYFQGSFEYLEAVRKSGVTCPLLCKEFVIDAWQIYYARSKGADAVLLIAGVLPDLDIKYMVRLCRKLGMTALVEVHDNREMDRVLKIDGVQLVGINNRNLETFEVDISNTKELLERRGEIIQQKGITLVGESGLFTPEDIAYVQNAGVTAVLVGESLLKQEDPGKAISGLFGKDLSM